MNKARMLELADHLEKIDRKKFDMHSFVRKFRVKGGRRVWNDDIDLDEGTSALAALQAMPKTCGTAACIAGWAVALHPRAAQHAIFNNGWGYSVADHAKAILDLDSDDADNLFHEHLDMTPKQAAKRIRRTVELGYVPK